MLPVPSPRDQRDGVKKIELASGPPQWSSSATSSRRSAAARARCWKMRASHESQQGSECVTNSYVSSSETSSRAASRSATEASACPSVLQLLANVASATRVRLGDPYGSRLIPKYTKDRQWKSVACREMWSQMDPRLRKALDKGDLQQYKPPPAFPFTPARTGPYSWESLAAAHASPPTSSRRSWTTGHT